LLEKAQTGRMISRNAIQQADESSGIADGARFTGE
jgi:hypothetical protein